jgi:cell division septum initiation protein DivIVA
MKPMAADHPVAEHPTDAFAILAGSTRGFDVGMRGYDRRQVDDHIGALEDELRASVGERDAAIARSSDLAAQYASGQAQIESLRRQLRAATDPLTEDTVDARVRTIIEAANSDAARTRDEAEAYVAQLRQIADEAAERTRALARTEAAQIIETASMRHAEADEEFRRRIAEADRYRVEVVERTAAEVDAARLQEEHLTQRAEAERNHLADLAAQQRADLDAQSRAKIATAESDFEIVLRERRQAEAEESQRRLDAARTEANAIVAAAQQRAAELDEHHNKVYANLMALHSQLGGLVDETSPFPSGAGSASGSGAGSGEGHAANGG